MTDPTLTSVRRPDWAGILLFSVGLVFGVVAYRNIVEHGMDPLVLVPSVVAAVIGAQSLTQRLVPRQAPDKSQTPGTDPTEGVDLPANWREVDLLDDDGYPTDEACDLISVFPGTPRDLVEDVLTPILDTFGSLTRTTSTDDRDRPVHEIRLVTGGWSGCEDTVAALKGSMFWLLWWRSSERGGAHAFRVPVDAWDEPMTVAPRRASRA